MILRIARARVARDHEGELFQRFRDQAEFAIGRISGLAALTFARHQLESGDVELVAVTVWRDVAAIEALYGAGWQDQLLIRGIDHIVADRSVEHLEVVVASVEDLLTRVDH